MTTQSITEQTNYYRDNPRQAIEDLFVILPIDSSVGFIPFRFTRSQERYWANQRQKMVIAKARRVKMSAIVEADFTARTIFNPNYHSLMVVQKPIEETLPPHVKRVEAFIRSTQKKLGGFPVLTRDTTQHKVFDYGESEHGARLESSITFVGSGSKDVLQGGGYDFIHATEIPSYEEDEYQSLLNGLQGSRLATVRWESRPESMNDHFYDLYQAAKNRESSDIPMFVPFYEEEEYFWPEGPLWDNADPILSKDGFPLEAEEQLLMDIHGLSWGQVRYWRKALADAKGNRDIRASQLAYDDESCWRTAGSPVVPGYVMDYLMGQVRQPLPKEMYPEGNDLNGMLRMWIRPQADETYAIYADPAEGYIQSHDTAITIRRARDWAYVGEIRGKISPEDTGRIMVKMGYALGTTLIGWEREPRSAGIRAIVIDQYHYPYVYKMTENKWGNADHIAGLRIDASTKDGIIGSMVDFMESGEYHTPSDILVKQWSQVQEGNTYKNDREKHQYNTAVLDMVMADAGCFQLRDQARRLLTRLAPRKKRESLVPVYLR